MNPDQKPKPGRIDLLYRVLGHHRNYVHYLCKLLTHGHQICTAGASDVDAVTDRFITGLTYFSATQGKVI